MNSLYYLEKNVEYRLNRLEKQAELERLVREAGKEKKTLREKLGEKLVDLGQALTGEKLAGETN